MNNKIELLAKTNGRGTVFRKVKEECAELVVALSHYEEFGASDRVVQSSDVLKEVADVEVMLAQLKYLMHGEADVETYKAQKIGRQLKRFGLKGENDED